MSVLSALVSSASAGCLGRAVRLVLSSLFVATAWANVCAAELPAVALHYGRNAPLTSLQAFDIAVIEPDHGFDPQAYRRSGKSELFAYISVGEVHPTRAYAGRIPKDWRIGRNAQWDSIVVDQAQSAWPAFFADEVVGPLWARGFRGFFLDTMDSYHLVDGIDQLAQQRGMISVIRQLRTRFPGIRLILNRGFELLPELKGEIFAVAAESLYRGWDPKKQRYAEVKPADREWLLGQLVAARDRFGVTAIAIDYVDPAARQLALDTARQIAAHGIVPYVADAGLGYLGAGLVEVLPRRILFLYNSAEAARVNASNIHRYAEMPLNHLGYVAEYVDVNGPLPAHVAAAEYAGVVTWFDGYLAPVRSAALSAWLAARIAEGTRIAVFGSFGFEPNGDFLRAAGLLKTVPSKGAVGIALRDALIGFESPPIPERRGIEPIRVGQPDAKVLLRLSDAAGTLFDAAALMPWGGFALNPFAVRVLPGEESQTRWIVEPFAFFQQALALPPLPVPDTTTVNGRRMFFAHIDGDGFPSRTEMPGRRLAAEVLLDEVLKRYPLPHAMSVIEVETAPDGAYPKDSALMEEVARRMFALPHVEIASHSYTHPFYWDSVERNEVREALQGYSLAPKGYVPSLKREITGSVDYIRSRLAPPGKPVGLMLWTGDAAPTEAALEVVDANDMVQMNGGYTVATRNYPSLTAVSSLGSWQGRRFHVYAPVMNENVYTNLWTGPFYGFERVTETLDFTGSPRRLKPINIYYHTYSASKRASLEALHKVYRHALSKAVTPVFPSEYVRIAMNFNDLVLARTLAGDRYIVRNAHRLRTLRIPPALGHPDLAASSGVAGYSEGPEGAYLHLSDHNALLRLGPTASRLPMLASANAHLAAMTRDGGALAFDLKGHVPLDFALAHIEQCTPTAGGKTIKAYRKDASLFHFRLNDHAATIELRCRVP
ncbi:MAG: bifunctional glycoside hydrolase 114/ polysaccharide deacetylase family protein [Methyloversatilis sp.]|jgi:hypothetical protein|nr:bifunctional glycoside hydrolase 114/ polysaccharide deacetylase family protein [Methyloversatilis sp.]